MLVRSEGRNAQAMFTFQVELDNENHWQQGDRVEDQDLDSVSIIYLKSVLRAGVSKCKYIAMLICIVELINLRNA